MIKKTHASDVDSFKERLTQLPRIWDGKSCILELKNADFNWQQMEWLGWYFEYKAKELLEGDSAFPGDKYGNVAFDLRKTINWDLKTSATKNKKVILNDKEAMDQSIDKDGFHGEIIALFDADYDTDRSFQQWHSNLKGGKSKYEVEREKRTLNSRRRKKSAKLVSLIFVIFGRDDLQSLSMMSQGRNSNGAPRKVKYMLDLRELHKFENYELKFQ